MTWWRDAVIYQIYPRSYQDSGGDGIGDIRGITSRLDHLHWLGIDAVWLSPTFPSPNADWGYDVADYMDVHPDLGGMDDLDTLVREAASRDIRIMLDLVPNHTSDRHPWFLDARSSVSSRHRDWYVWADAKAGGLPNNWVSAFMGPAWSLDERSGQYYLHNFLPEQPDLNWWNPQVRDAFDDILRFWFDRGVSGFRIDVVQKIVKDAELRDNPPATESDDPVARRRGQRFVYNQERPETHDVLRRWRRIADSYDPQRLLLGEVYILDLKRMAPFYGNDDELHLAFNFQFHFTRLEAGAMRSGVDESLRTLPRVAWPVWSGSNHDASRFPSRWARGDPGAARCALMMLLTLRGTPVLYYGDEIGMRDTELTLDDLRDPVGKHYWPSAPGRDPVRTPMHWEPGPGAGFTDPGVRPWLPFGDHASCNVADQRRDESSMLHLCRDLLAYRRRESDLRSGGYEAIDSPDGTLAYRRGEGHVVALNFTDRDVVVDVRGTVAIGTNRSRDAEPVPNGLRLRGCEGVVLVRAE